MRIKNSLIAVTLIAFLYGLVWHPRATLYPVTVGISVVQYPFVCVYAVTLQPIFTAFSRFKIHREYHEILERNQCERNKLLAELIRTQTDLIRSEELHKLGIPYEKSPLLKPCAIAQIIYKQLDKKDSFFIIDKGSTDGVARDMVAVLNNVLLGRVIEVYPWYAKVMPVSDAGCHVPIVCASSRAHGVFHGNQLDFISHLEPLVINELVITSGDGLIYPQGFALGRIKKFTLNDLGFLYEVTVDPLYDLSGVGYCAIISKNMQQAEHEAL